MFKEKELLEIAIDSVKSAKSFLLYNKDIRVDKNENKDIKLDVDRKSEKIILNVLKKTNINILSEERGFIEINKKSKLLWIIDPIDGSLNFFRGIPLCCISVSLWNDNEPLFGVIYDLSRENLYTGIVGKGSFLNSNQIFTSSNNKISESIIATGFPVYSSFETDNLSSFINKIQKFKKVRLFGSAALSLAMLSEGAIDVYEENKIALWDVAAGLAIAKASGAKIIFKKINNNYLYDVKASNGKLNF